MIRTGMGVGGGRNNEFSESKEDFTQEGEIPYSLHSSPPSVLKLHLLFTARNLGCEDRGVGHRTHSAENLGVPLPAT